MANFETKPVQEILNNSYRTKHGAFYAAFAELPQELAIFFPVKGRGSNIQIALSKRHPERTVRQTSNQEGSWLWWEPKEVGIAANR